MTLLVLSTQVFGKEDTSKKVDNWYLNFMNETQKFISNQWVGLNYNMDAFFTNEYYEKSKNKSLIMAYYGAFKKESQPAEYNFDVRIKVHLPKTTRKMKIVIEKERNEIFESQRGDAGLLQGVGSSDDVTASVGRSNYLAGLTYLLFYSDYFETFVDTGMKVLLPLDPYMRIRFQKNIKGSINTYLSQRFIIYRQDGFSEISTASFATSLSDTFQLQQSNNLSWSDNEDLFIGRNSISLFQNLDDKRNISYVIGANFKLSPKIFYDNYDFAINFRQLIHETWLFGYFSTGVNYQKGSNWNDNKFIQGRVEIFFR